MRSTDPTLHPLVALIISHEHAVASELRARGEYGSKWPGRAWNDPERRQ